MAFFYSLTLPTPEVVVIHDDYDPRKAEFIRPATDHEIMQAQVDLNLRQIAKLETLVARLDSQMQPNPNILHYHEALEELQRECPWETASMTTRCSSSRSSSISLQGESSDNESVACTCEEEPSLIGDELGVQDFEDFPSEAIPSILTSRNMKPGDELFTRDTKTVPPNPNVASGLWEFCFSASNGSPLFPSWAQRNVDTAVSEKVIRRQVLL